MTNGRMQNGQHNHNTQQPRKQLSDQIDRLDVLVDGLADELPKAVADATREGTRLAVGDVLKEILTDPATIAHFRNLFAPQTPTSVPTQNPVPTPVPVATPTIVTEPRPGFFARLKQTVRDSVKQVSEAIRERFAQWREKLRQMRANVEATVNTVRNILPLGRYLFIAVVVGLTMAVTCYVAPPQVSAVVTGIGATILAMTVQVFRWVRRSARSLILLK
jgi:hypothetical protein